jgi:hypothetical protein
MLLKFAGLAPGIELVRAANLIAAQGREAIQVASELLGSAPGRGGATTR